MNHDSESITIMRHVLFPIRRTQVPVHSHTSTLITPGPLANQCYTLYSGGTELLIYPIDCFIFGHQNRCHSNVSLVITVARPTCVNSLWQVDTTTWVSGNSWRPSRVPRSHIHVLPVHTGIIHQMGHLLASYYRFSMSSDGSGPAWSDPTNYRNFVVKRLLKRLPERPVFNPVARFRKRRRTWIKQRR